MINDKEDLFSCKLKTEKVEIDGWGKFKIQELTAEKQQEFEKHINEKDQLDLMCLLIIESVIDESGDDLFNKDDINRLKKLPAAPLIELFNTILKLNKIGDDEIKEAAKN